MTQMRTIESVPFATDLRRPSPPRAPTRCGPPRTSSAWPTCLRRILVSRALTDPARSLADKQNLAKEAFASHELRR